MTTLRSQAIQKYAVEVTTKQPFRIGAFADPLSDIESPVATLGGQVVIQGSTLKGALRAQMEEHLILNYAGDETMKPCIPAAYNNLSFDERALIDQGTYKGPCCGYGYDRGPQERICPVCYLLGTMGLVGFVQVPYLYSDVAPEEGYSNRRDRALNRAADGSNRSFQIIAPDTLFSGQLMVITEDKVRGWKLGQPRRLQSRRYSDAWLQKQAWPTDRVLEELIVERLKAVNSMGGFISKGFGNVEVKVEPVDGQLEG